MKICQESQLRNLLLVNKRKKLLHRLLDRVRKKNLFLIYKKTNMSILVNIKTHNKCNHKLHIRKLIQNIQNMIKVHIQILRFLPTNKSPHINYSLWQIKNLLNIRICSISNSSRCKNHLLLNNL